MVIVVFMHTSKTTADSLVDSTACCFNPVCATQIEAITNEPAKAEMPIALVNDIKASVSDTWNEETDLPPNAYDHCVVGSDVDA